MPRLSIWFVRASLLYLLAGITLGALMLANKGITFDPSLIEVLPIHVEFLLVGWLIQLAFGVAFWFLPRYGTGAPRGNERLVWGAFILLNAGVILTAFQLWLQPALLVGRISEILGILLYIAGSWRRVKPMVVDPNLPHAR